jgi:hypothetical protein
MAKPRNCQHLSEVDWVNQKVAAACGLPLKFLYPPSDGIHPSTRAHQMELEEYTQIQRQNDTLGGIVISECKSCGEHISRPPPPPAPKTMSQMTAMSEAWSRELRAKVEESDRLREAKKPQICVEIDDYWD